MQIETYIIPVPKDNIILVCVCVHLFDALFLMTTLCYKSHSTIPTQSYRSCILQYYLVTMTTQLSESVWGQCLAQGLRHVEPRNRGTRDWTSDLLYRAQVCVGVRVKERWGEREGVRGGEREREREGRVVWLNLLYVTFTEIYISEIVTKNWKSICGGQHE